MGCKWLQVTGDDCIAWALDAVCSVSPEPGTVYLLCPWCSTASPSSKTHLFAICQKVNNTLWLKCGFFLRGRRNVLPGEERSTLAWEQWYMGSRSAFQLHCWKLLREAILVPPSKLSELPGIAWKPMSTLQFLWFGNANVISSPGVWFGFEDYPPSNRLYWNNRLKIAT